MPLAALGCALLALGLALRQPETIPWAILLTAAAYVTGREGGAGVDVGAAVMGALLLLSAELASWSIDHDARIAQEPSLTTYRLLVIGLLVAGALVLGFVLLGAAAATTATGLTVAAVGVAAAVAAVALVLRLVRG